MRAVVQRVSKASVTVDQKVVGAIDVGLLVLLGVEEGDQENDARYMAEKIASLRIFADENDKMNLSLLDVKGKVLAVSQFTLLGDCRKGRRPSFVDAAGPENGNQLYQSFCEHLKANSVSVEQGVFRADMQVALVNDGPVTILVDSRKLF